MNSKQSSKKSYKTPFLTFLNYKSKINKVRLTGFILRVLQADDIDLILKPIIYVSMVAKLSAKQLQNKRLAPIPKAQGNISYLAKNLCYTTPLNHHCV